MLLTDLIGGIHLSTQKNISASSDPTVVNDVTTGITKFSVWHNTVTGEMFDCKSDALGAAVWIPRIDTQNIVTRDIVTSVPTLGGAGTTKIQNIVATSNTNYGTIVVPDANTAYFIDG